MRFERRFSGLDRLLIEVDHALRTSLAATPVAGRESPAAAVGFPSLNEAEREHVAGLMRINHSGEVCAQPSTWVRRGWQRPRRCAHLLHAADEEADHLGWCAQRLDELQSRPSLLNPFWYVGSYGIGIVAGLAGDGYNLGFVVETERQVESHLQAHLNSLPQQDGSSRAILAEMMTDEARHAEQASSAGAKELPMPIPRIMAACSQVMKWIAYRV